MHRFVCNRYKSLGVMVAGKKVKFIGGVFETEDDRLAERLIKHEWVEPEPGAGGIIFYEGPLRPIEVIESAPDAESTQEVETDGVDNEGSGQDEGSRSDDAEEGPAAKLDHRSRRQRQAKRLR